MKVNSRDTKNPGQCKARPK